MFSSAWIDSHLFMEEINALTKSVFCPDAGRRLSCLEASNTNQKLLSIPDAEKILTSDLPIDNAYNRLSVNY